MVLSVTTEPTFSTRELKTLGPGLVTVFELRLAFSVTIESLLETTGLGLVAEVLATDLTTGLDEVAGTEVDKYLLVIFEVLTGEFAATVSSDPRELLDFSIAIAEVTPAIDAAERLEGG